MADEVPERGSRLPPSLAVWVGSRTGGTGISAKRRLILGTYFTKNRSSGIVVALSILFMYLLNLTALSVASRKCGIILQAGFRY